MNEKPNRQIRGNKQSRDEATPTHPDAIQPVRVPNPAAEAEQLPSGADPEVSGVPTDPAGLEPTPPEHQPALVSRVSGLITHLPLIGNRQPEPPPSEQRIAMEAAREGMNPEAWRYQRPNFRYGVANGIIFSFGDALSSAGIVIPWFISRLSSSNVLVGLAPAIAAAGSLLPQLFIASRVQHLPRKMPWYRNVGYVRAAAIGAICICTLLFSGRPELLLPAFFTFYTIYALASGVTSIPWMEIVAKTIPPRRRGLFFGMRSFWGGVVALIASTFVSFILAQGDQAGNVLAFPLNFALLFGLTSIFFMAGILTWQRIREPAEVVNAEKMTIWAAIRRGPVIVREDQSYRAFLSIRLLMSLATIADPFYVIYAKNQLQAPIETLGLFMAAATTSSLVSNLIWAPLPNRMNPRALLRLRVVAGLLTPTTALLLPPLLIATGLVVPGQPSVGVAFFAIVFALSGFAGAGANIVNNDMLLEIAPPAQRPIYIGFMNTLLGIGTLVPILGGTLVDAFGFELVFGLAMVIILGALVLTRNISSVRKRA